MRAVAYRVQESVLGGLKPAGVANPLRTRFCARNRWAARRDLRFSTVLSDQPPPGWTGQIDQFIFPALAILNEVAFFHRASRTLILADLAFNFVNTASAFTRLALWLDGALGGLAVPRTAKLAFAFNRGACRKAIDRILEWDFDRVIVAHGDVVETGARRSFARRTRLHEPRGAA